MTLTGPLVLLARRASRHQSPQAFLWLWHRHPWYFIIIIRFILFLICMLSLSAKLLASLLNWCGGWLCDLSNREHASQASPSAQPPATPLTRSDFQSAEAKVLCFSCVSMATGRYAHLPLHACHQMCDEHASYRTGRDLTILRERHGIFRTVA